MDILIFSSVFLNHLETAITSGVEDYPDYYDPNREELYPGVPLAQTGCFQIWNECFLHDPSGANIVDDMGNLPNPAFTGGCRRFKSE